MMSQPQLLQPKPAPRIWLWPSLAAAALLIAFLLPMPQNGAIGVLPSVCTFHLTTGLPCPGCGLTRSVVSCAHGQWAAAFHYHPLGPIIFAAFVGLAAIGVLGLLQPQRVAQFFERTAKRTGEMKWLLGASGVALIVIWLARLAGLLPSP